MAKFSLILSLVVLLGTAVLGFMTKTEISNKVADLKATKQRLGETTNQLTTTKANLKKTEETLVVANKTVDDQKGQIETLNTDIAARKADVEKLTASVAEKETLIASQTKQIADFQNPVADPTQPPTGRVAELMKENDDLKKQSAEQTQIANTVKEQVKGLEENLASARQSIQHYERPITQAGLAGRVMNVSPGWGFVVIDLGDKQGVSVNSPLFVMRGNQMVARLKITSVEPRTSVADVVQGTMARGTAVQVGDRVVFPGVRTQGANPPADPAAASDATPAVTAAPPARH